jgi:hypothetical protein
MSHRSLYLVVSLDRFVKLMILHPHMNCPKPIANMVLDRSPSFNTLLLAMLTVQHPPQMSYSVSQSKRVIRSLCESTFNLNQGPTTKRSLIDTDGIKTQAMPESITTTRDPTWSPFINLHMIHRFSMDR